MLFTRRGIIQGLVSLIAAPAIVRADSLMKIRGIILPTNTILTDIVSMETAGYGWVKIVERLPILSPYGRPIYVTKVVPTASRWPDGYPADWEQHMGDAK